jgi:uncharacterized protein
MKKPAVSEREGPVFLRGSPMGIPSKQQCFQLMGEMGMMDHIAAHCLRVCHVATFLADRLDLPPEDLNRDLVERAALLHDITKTRSFETKENHAETAEDLLRDLGHPELGRIVGQHVRLDAYAATGTLSEADIVNYSDKRVLHDQVVSLDKRFDYILEKYARVPEDRERIRWLTRETAGLEKRIFDRLPFPPDTLDRHLDPRAYRRDLSAYRAQIPSQRS